MSCDVGKGTKRLENELAKEKRKKDWRMSCDIREATEGLENEL